MSSIRWKSESLFCGYFYNPFSFHDAESQPKQRKILLLHASDFNFTSKMKKRLFLFSDSIDAVPHQSFPEFQNWMFRSHFQFSCACRRIGTNNARTRIDFYIVSAKHDFERHRPRCQSVLKDKKLSVSYCPQEEIEKQGNKDRRNRNFDWIEALEVRFGNPIR